MAVNCIKAVCNAADLLADRLAKFTKDMGELIGKLPIYLQHIRCVVTGAAGQICNTPSIPAAHPTLAEMLSRLNATSIAGVDGDSFTASDGQTVFTLGGAVTNANYIEVKMNGALQHETQDFSVAGTTLTFVYPLVAGDLVDTRRFYV